MKRSKLLPHSSHLQRFLLQILLEPPCYRPYSHTIYIANYLCPSLFCQYIGTLITGALGRPRCPPGKLHCLCASTFKFLWINIIGPLEFRNDCSSCCLLKSLLLVGQIRYRQCDQKDQDSASYAGSWGILSYFLDRNDDDPNYYQEWQEWHANNQLWTNTKRPRRFEPHASAAPITLSLPSIGPVLKVGNGSNCRVERMDRQRTAPGVEFCHSPDRPGAPVFFPFLPSSAG